MRSYLLAASIFLSLNSLAGTLKTVTLDVKNMTCELCPVTVKKALEKTPGVAKAQIDFAKKTATVTFDPVVVTVVALTQSTTHAGYPSIARELK
jgi:mercuric ion binding protein